MFEDECDKARPAAELDDWRASIVQGVLPGLDGLQGHAKAHGRAVALQGRKPHVAAGLKLADDRR